MHSIPSLSHLEHFGCSPEHLSFLVPEIMSVMCKSALAPHLESGASSLGNIRHSSHAACLFGSVVVPSAMTDYFLRLNGKFECLAITTR